MSSPIVTLTTDWGESGFFAGMVKGKLYSMISDVRVVDISHGLIPHDIVSATFVIKNACMWFPKGTVHIIDILSEEHSSQGFVVVQAKGQYYLCSNHGLPYMVFGDEYDKAVEIRPYWNSPSYNFAAYDIYCPTAERLIEGVPLSEIGEEVPLYERRLPPYIVMGNLIKVHVWHIDGYGNAYLDMKYDEFMELLGGRNFEMNIRGVIIKDIQVSYSDCERAALTISSTGYLEVAIYMVRAVDILGIQLHSMIDIMIK